MNQNLYNWLEELSVWLHNFDTKIIIWIDLPAPAMSNTRSKIASLLQLHRWGCDMPQMSARRLFLNPLPVDQRWFLVRLAFSQNPPTPKLINLYTVVAIKHKYLNERSNGCSVFGSGNMDVKILLTWNIVWWCFIHLNKVENISLDRKYRRKQLWGF